MRVGPAICQVEASGTAALALGAAPPSHGPPEAGLHFRLSRGEQTQRLCVTIAWLHAGLGGGWRGMYRINIWTEILFFSLFLGASGACRPGSSAVFGAPLPRGGFSLLRLFFSPVAARVPPPFHRVAAIFSAPRCQASTKLSNQQMSLYRSPTPHAQSALYASFILAIYNLFLLSDDGYYYPSETSSHIGNVLGGGYRDSLAQHFEFI